MDRTRGSGYELPGLTPEEVARGAIERSRAIRNFLAVQRRFKAVYGEARRDKITKHDLRRVWEALVGKGPPPAEELSPRRVRKVVQGIFGVELDARKFAEHLSAYADVRRSYEAMKARNMGADDWLVRLVAKEHGAGELTLDAVTETARHVMRRIRADQGEVVVDAPLAPALGTSSGDA